MTKRGAEGTMTIGDRRLELSGGDGRYIVTEDGRRLGSVTRSRHTYRTTFAHSRIGYDRTHWCWHTQPSFDLGLRGSWCHRTLRDGVKALVP